MLFVGGCDPDRLPLIGALVDAGSISPFSAAIGIGIQKQDPLAWHRDQIRSEAPPLPRGFASALSGALIATGTMRSFEAAAIGGCILAEDTADIANCLVRKTSGTLFQDSAEMVRRRNSFLQIPKYAVVFGFRVANELLRAATPTPIGWRQCCDFRTPMIQYRLVSCRTGNVASDCSDEGRFGSNIRVAITQ